MKWQTQNRGVVVELDRIDLKILNAVQQDCRIGADTLADMAGLSPSAVQRRLNKLREIGVIQKEVAVLDAEKVGRPLTVIAHVTLESEKMEGALSFRKAMQSLPEVVQCYFVTGDIDYVVIVSVQTMSEYADFQRKAFFDNPHIKYFGSYVSVETVKSTTSLPIRDE
ncbi:MAG: Lrp/AsnC family transcriptional regulator [Hyphococcus sp.]